MKAFFLDRDGTINVDTDFVHTVEEWQWCDKVLEAIRWMNENQYKVIVVTNQSGIARGRYTMDDVQKLHTWVDSELAKLNLKIDDWFMAPHHPKFDREPHDYSPEDRKPGTGMFLKAIKKHDIEPKQSFMAGDKITDLEPAIELGIKPYFIRSRHEPNQDKSWLNDHGIATHNSLYDVIQAIRRKTS